LRKNIPVTTYLSAITASVTLNPFQRLVIEQAKAINFAPTDREEARRILEASGGSIPVK
jgi:hypothetical protein